MKNSRGARKQTIRPAKACVTFLLGLCALLYLVWLRSGPASSSSAFGSSLDSSAGRVASTSGRESLKLLLSTHTQLFWYLPESQEQIPVHSGQGVYYGVLPDGNGTQPLQSLWVVSRPHNWHPQSTEEALLRLQLPSGAVLERKQLRSRFTHDAIRVGDKAYVCNTDQGQILELAFPSMEQLRSFDLFTNKQHINTLASYDGRTLWVVLHNLGASLVAQVDLASGQIVRKIPNVGVNAHGLIAWRGSFVMLSSKETRLITLDLETETITTLWKGRAGFLKGLSVIDDVAYFGVSPAMARQGRDAPTVACDIVAVDLVRRRELYRRKVATRGLLNVVSAPQLSPASTFVAQYTDAGGRAQLRARGVRAPDALAAQTYNTRAERVQAPQVTGSVDGGTARWSAAWLTRQVAESDVAGAWSTGMPYMNLSLKGDASAGIEQRRRGRSIAVPGWSKEQPPVYVHLGRAPAALLAPLQERLRTMPQDWWRPEVQASVNAVLPGREKNLAATKPGVNTMFLLFSTRNADRMWQLPLFEHFQAQLEPLLSALMGPDVMGKIVRLQLAQMTPGAHIRLHRDSGPWAHMAHRVHVVVATQPEIGFYSCPFCGGAALHSDNVDCLKPPKGTCHALDTSPDSIFEVDNLMIHEVENPGTAARVHLVADVAEHMVPPRKVLAVGQRCRYGSTVTAEDLANGC